MTEADRQYRAATQNFQRLRAEEKMRDDALVKARDAAWLRKMWRPIETCPSDTVVLLYTPHLHVTNPERVEARVFRDTKGGSQHAWATHWMPLPLALATDAQIESEIQAKELTAPRVTPQQIEDSIKAQYTFTAYNALGDGVPRVDELKLLTIAVLVLKNGFTVTGESACASPENFDAELGAKIAVQNAKAKIWPLEGYLLKSKLSI